MGLKGFKLCHTGAEQNPGDDTGPTLKHGRALERVQMIRLLLDVIRPVSRAAAIKRQAARLGGGFCDGALKVFFFVFIGSRVFRLWLAGFPALVGGFSGFRFPRQASEPKPACR